jgi:hypothetical protein
MTLTAAAKKVRARRARRPIYFVVRRVVDPDTGQMIGALVPNSDVDARLLRERNFHINREIRAELKQTRDEGQHRLIHKIGQLMVENVEGWEQLSSHDAIKRLQMESNTCCETVEIDARPVIRAVLAMVQALVGKRTFAKLARALPAIETVPVRVAESLAFDEMEQDRFQQLFDGITEHIGQKYAHVMLDDVRAEFWEMAGRNRRAA